MMSTLDLHSDHGEAIHPGRVPHKPSTMLLFGTDVQEGLREHAFDTGVRPSHAFGSEAEP